MRKLVLFDASGYIHRAFHALPPLTTSQGEPVNALYGFSRMVSKVLREEKPDLVGVCFDTPAPTFRHKAFKDYKATRLEIDDSLLHQLPLAWELAQAWGLPCVKMDGYEADDLIATLATRGAGEGWDVLILSGDKDILQLVGKKIHVRDEIRGVEYDDEKVRERYGVSPGQLVDLLCLMGDKVDNVPGIPGVGPKTASKWIAEFGSLEGLYENLNGRQAGVKEKLFEYKTAVFKNRELIKLKADAPLSFSVDTLTVKNPDAAVLPALLKRLEFRGELFGAEALGAASTLEVNKKRIVHTVLTEGELNYLQERLQSAGRLSYDVETSGLNQNQCDLVGLALAVKEDESWYIPLGHVYIGAPTQLPWAAVQSALKPFFENPMIPKCGQNLKFDNAVLARHGLLSRGPSFDTMVAAYCLDPARSSFGLKDLAADFLNERMTRIEELIGKGKEEKIFSSVPIETAAPYAAADAEVVLRLMDILEAKLNDEKLRDLFDRLEMPLVEVIQDMEAAGIRIDVDHLRQVGQKFELEQRGIEKEIYADCGEEFVINSPKQLSRILFEKLKLPVIKRTKTGYSTDEDVLLRLAPQHPVCRKLLSYRELSKLSSTYVDALLKMADEKTHRVHTSFNQTGTITGRLSSSEPNLQNIPVRTEHGREIRRAFIASPGAVLLSADYSQIDLRALAHITGDPVLVQTFASSGDVHAMTASQVFLVPLSEVTAEMRRRAKAINFGIVYGQQAYGLSQSLGIPQKEAQQIIDQYFERYSRVKVWIEDTLEEARRTEVVATLGGRRRRVKDVNSSISTVRGFGERVAINTPIQGTSADIIKSAMIRVAKSLNGLNFKTKMILQVHDELLFDVPEKEMAAVLPVIREGMEGAYALRVPLLVDIKVGPNWNDMGKVERRK